MKNIISLLLATSCILYANPYNKCVGCHGTKGEIAALNGKSRIIKEMTKSEIISVMNGYKNGTYGRAFKGIMKAQAKLLSDKDIALIADMVGK